MPLCLYSSINLIQPSYSTCYNQVKHSRMYIMFLLVLFSEDSWRLWSEFSRIGTPVQLDVETDGGDLRVIMKLQNGVQLKNAVCNDNFITLEIKLILIPFLGQESNIFYFGAFVWGNPGQVVILGEKLGWLPILEIGRRFVMWRDEHNMIPHGVVDPLIPDSRGVGEPGTQKGSGGICFADCTWSAV